MCYWSTCKYIVSQILHVYVWILNIVNIYTWTVVGIGGMDEYTMKYAYQINENVWLDRDFEPSTPA